jgi:hypothetical protein
MTSPFQVMLYRTYDEVNADLELEAHGVEKLSPDRNAEHPALIITVYKWTYNHGRDADPPDLSWLCGLEFSEHVALSDKLDLFIYVDPQRR